MRPINSLAHRCEIFLIFCALFCSDSLVADNNSDSVDSDSLVLAPAESLLAGGDTTGALELLGRIDTEGGQSYSLRLQRGEHYLALGKLGLARAEFSAAYWDDDPEVSARAHIGLGDCYRQMRHRNYDAVREYRLAIRDEPHNCEARYKLTMTGFALRQTDGYRMAARELAKLICTDPGYHDTYRVWRDSILDKTPGELRRVHPKLIEHMAASPGSRDWWLDIASDRYHLDEYHSALDALNQHHVLCPDTRVSECHLVRGRCLLALGDTAAFEREYNAALEAASRPEDFAVLARHANHFQRTGKEGGAKAGKARAVAHLDPRFLERKRPGPGNPNQRALGGALLPPSPGRALLRATQSSQPDPDQQIVQCGNGKVKY